MITHILRPVHEGVRCPAKREAPADGEHGRGLRIVEARAAHWGWRPEEGGKSIFAILAKEPEP